MLLLLHHGGSILSRDQAENGSFHQRDLKKPSYHPVAEAADYSGKHNFLHHPHIHTLLRLEKTRTWVLRSYFLSNVKHVAPFKQKILKRKEVFHNNQFIKIQFLQDSDNDKRLVVFSNESSEARSGYPSIDNLEWNNGR